MQQWFHDIWKCRLCLPASKQVTYTHCDVPENKGHEWIVVCTEIIIRVDPCLTVSLRQLQASYSTLNQLDAPMQQWSNIHTSHTKHTVAGTASTTLAPRLRVTSATALLSTDQVCIQEKEHQQVQNLPGRMLSYTLDPSTPIICTTHIHTTYMCCLVRASPYNRACTKPAHN